MKKYIYSILMAAMAAFTFSSCEDVPAPYDMPEKPDTPETTDTPKGTGTAEDPFNAAAAQKEAQTLEQGQTTEQVYYIKGIIQDFVAGKNGDTGEFNSTYGNASFKIADDANSTKFYVYRVYYFGGEKWKEGDTQLKVGDEVVVCCKLTNYSGTLETAQGGKLISINGKTNGGDTPIPGDAKGTGTKEDPFNSVAAQNLAASLPADQATDQTYYIKGKIQEIASNGEYNAQYGNASFYIADDAKSTKFYVFRVYYYEGKKWAEGNTQIKVGDEVIVCCKLVNYKGNTPESNQGGSLISLNGKTSDSGSVDPTPDPTPDTGDGMTSNAIVNGKIGNNALQEKYYGSQSTTDESTWYSWSYNNITYKGTKICISDGTNGKGIQMQGNNTDATKQGFIFNSIAFSKDIKSITIYLSTTATSKYAPSYSLYAAKTANGRDTKVTGTSTNETSGDWKTYTEVYDLSSYNTKYFTLWNNTTGALYIEKIVVTLK